MKIVPAPKFAGIGSRRIDKMAKGGTGRWKCGFGNGEP